MSYLIHSYFMPRYSNLRNKNIKTKCQINYFNDLFWSENNPRAIVWKIRFTNYCSFILYRQYLVENVYSFIQCLVNVKYNFKVRQLEIITKSVLFQKTILENTIQKLLFENMFQNIVRFFAALLVQLLLKILEVGENRNPHCEKDFF